jgi:hypothetical protein
MDGELPVLLVHPRRFSASAHDCVWGQPPLTLTLTAMNSALRRPGLFEQEQRAGSSRSEIPPSAASPADMLSLGELLE